MSAATAEAGDATGARERILAAATTLAGREGLGALTTRRVAKEAGVNVGLLHYYFESKESLVDETLGLFLDEMLAATATVAPDTVVIDAPADTEVPPEDLLSQMFSKALVLAWKRPGLIFSLIGRLAAAVAKSTQERRVPEDTIGSEPPLPLGSMMKMQTALFGRVRPLLVARLGEDPDLVGRRAIQLFTSIFHPILFTPFPGIIFGVDLEDEERRREYVRAVVLDALEAPRGG